jgi:tubulin gamma
MRLIGSTIRSVPPSPNRPWSSRIVLGCWAAKYLPLCATSVPGFPVTHIGFSVLYASYFFSVPNVSFNMLLAVLMTPWGHTFLRKARTDQRPVYAWTVNEERRMRWGIRHELDGVITDDPKKFLEVRRDWHEGMREGFNLLMWLDVLRINLFALIFGLLFQVRFGFGDTKPLIKSKN